ncbi:MAG: type VI secretion system baseplate subunit TssF [Desulfobacterales bacterium]|nr:type VI secretion system baseplate subunit TssF [Desulfobacterales bacterium]
MGARVRARVPQDRGAARAWTASRCADPYVERLLGGLRLPRARGCSSSSTPSSRASPQRLLEIVYPHYLAPTPSMAGRAVPAATRARRTSPAASRVPRGTPLRSAARQGRRRRACEFRTAHDVTLLAARADRAREFILRAPDLPLTRPAGSPRGQGAACACACARPAGLTLRPDWRSTGCASSSRGADEVADRACTSCCSATRLGVVVRPAGAPAPWHELLPRPSRSRPVGLRRRRGAAARTRPRSFQGYRLLQEYFAFPQRFLFVDLAGLAPRLRRCSGNELELVAAASSAATRGSRASVDAAQLRAASARRRSTCFPSAPTASTSPSAAYEYHVVPDRTRPMDFEVYEVTGVTGLRRPAPTASSGSCRFYAAFAPASSPRARARYLHASQREPRLLSAAQRRSGPRSSYIGSEVFICAWWIADEAPFRRELRQLCGDSAVHQPRPAAAPCRSGLRRDRLRCSRSAAPVQRDPLPDSGPSAPDVVAARRRHRAGGSISQLSLNYLSLADDRRAARAPRRCASCSRLYAPIGEPADAPADRGPAAGRRRGLWSRRLPDAGPGHLRPRPGGRRWTVDELALRGRQRVPASAACWSSFFARHVSINFVHARPSLQLARRGGEIMPAGCRRCGEPRPTL